MIKTTDGFNEVLRKFVLHQRNSQTTIWECAKFALTHFENCGDLGPLQRTFDAMSKGYANRNALVKWSMTHAPILFESGKFSKDKNDEALPFDLQGAFSQKFWEAFPIQEVTTYFDCDDVKKAIANVVKRFQRENMRTTDDKARVAISKIEALSL